PVLGGHRGAVVAPPGHSLATEEEVSGEAVLRDHTRAGDVDPPHAAIVYDRVASGGVEGIAADGEGDRALPLRVHRDGRVAQVGTDTGEIPLLGDAGLDLPALARGIH